MTSETYLDLTYDRKGQKRPSRPKLLKLTEVSMPHRNRKKTKLKVKERSQSNARERIYDDPAYTDDISHLALPLRRNSGPDKIEAGSFHKRKPRGDKENTHHYTKRLDPLLLQYKRDGSSSSDGGGGGMMPPPLDSGGGGKTKRGQSLERANIIDRSPKKREKRDRSAKQRRNLSLDNTLSSSLRRSLEKSEPSLKSGGGGATIGQERSKSKHKSSMNRQNVSEGWNSCLAATSDSSKATENEESYSGERGGRKDSKMQIGKRFLRGEIGIKSFNYYLIKEGLKSSKKFVEKKRNSLTRNDPKKLHTRSEENIYEEIFFVDKNSDNDDHHSKYPDCELCMQECTKENCEYCYEDIRSRQQHHQQQQQQQQYFGSLGRNDRHPLYASSSVGGLRSDNNIGIGGSSMGAGGGGTNKFPLNSHILEFQSYNPNNPGVYKIETTPVAFTSDYNPIHQMQQQQNASEGLNKISNYPHPQPPQLAAGGTSFQGPPPSTQHANQIQMAAQQQQHLQRRTSRSGSQLIGPRLNNTTATTINTKSSSSSDSLHHKYGIRPDQTIRSMDLYDDYNNSNNHPPNNLYGSTGGIGGHHPISAPYEPNIYKSDSKVSIISEYSVRSESSNRNFRCGEISDSSLGDSMFSYSTQQKRYFGSSESCRFAFECRRCSLDGEKCSFSDNCRYECRNCDCSSSYFSSDFDDLNYNNHRRKCGSQNSQRSYEYYNDTIDVKQSKYAQDFFKHVNDVKRSIYQAEVQRSGGGVPIDSYGTIPPPKSADFKKSIHYDTPQQQRQYHRQPQPPASSTTTTTTTTTSRTIQNGSPHKMAGGSNQTSKSYTTLPLIKDNIHKKSNNTPHRKSSITTLSHPISSSSSATAIVDANGKNLGSLKRASGGEGGRDSYIIYSAPGPITLDKSLKYSDGKIYAQPIITTTTASNATSTATVTTNRRGDLSLERTNSRKKETGAIPKLSASTVPSSHQLSLASNQKQLSAAKQIQQPPKSPCVSPKLTSRHSDTSKISPKTLSSAAVAAPPPPPTTSPPPLPPPSTASATVTKAAIVRIVAGRNSNDNQKIVINKETKRNLIVTENPPLPNDNSSKELLATTTPLRKYYQQQQQQQHQQQQDEKQKLTKQQKDKKSQNSDQNYSIRSMERQAVSRQKFDNNSPGGGVVAQLTTQVEQFKGKPRKKTKSMKQSSRENVLGGDDEDDEVFYDAQSENSAAGKIEKRRRCLSIPVVTSASATPATTPNKHPVAITDGRSPNNDKTLTTNQLSVDKKTTSTSPIINLIPDSTTPTPPITTAISLNPSTTITTTDSDAAASTFLSKTPSTEDNNNHKLNESSAEKCQDIKLHTKTTVKVKSPSAAAAAAPVVPQPVISTNIAQEVPVGNDPESTPIKTKFNQNMKTESTAIVVVSDDHHDGNKTDDVDDDKSGAVDQSNTTVQRKALVNIALTAAAANKSKALTSVDQQQTNSMMLTTTNESAAKQIPQNVANEGETKENESTGVSFKSPHQPNESKHDHKQTVAVESKANNVDVVVQAYQVDTAAAAAIVEEKLKKSTSTTTSAATTKPTTTVSVTTTTTSTPAAASAAADDGSPSSGIGAIPVIFADEDFSRVSNAATVAGAFLNRDQQSADHHHPEIQNNNININLDNSETATSTDESYLTRTSNDLSSITTDKIDISDLPLPALPPKRRRNRSKTSIPTTSFPSSSDDTHLHYAAKRRESLETSTRNFTEKLEARKMHYHSMGHMGHHNNHNNSITPSTGGSPSTSGIIHHPNNMMKPTTYLFGENRYSLSHTTNHYPKKAHHSATSINTIPTTTNNSSHHHHPNPATINNDEIYLNKSGWVQVNSKRITNNDENIMGLQSQQQQQQQQHHLRKSNQNSIRLENQNGAAGGGNSLKNPIRVIQIDSINGGGYGGSKQQQQQQPVYAVPRITNSKIEELISRSEARRNSSSVHRAYMKPGYKIIDPQIASLLNERPGFLPVKTFMDLESPPPITPILSPPPAFQDTKAKYRNLGTVNGRIQVTTATTPGGLRQDQKSNKGMVFSRSFEYDNRKNTDHYAETFSKSFDCNLSDKPAPLPALPQKRDRSPNFGNLTGCSPNYLTKKEATRSRENSPNYQTQGGYLNASTLAQTKESPVYSNPRKFDKGKTNSFDRNGRSRRAQFSRVGSVPNPPQPVSRFRSFDTSINQRLNSCDSGARSDLSNDEVDDDDDHSSEFLTASYQPQSSFKQQQQQQKQRSLTPERYDSQSSQNSFRKQRSLTPESRSLTPEDRRKKGSQVSLSSRQNSGSRNNTLERKQKYEDKSLSASRSSSSSSYSGGEHPDIPHRRSTTRCAKTQEEHRIRRSRSLQLSEKSPNRGLVQAHKNGQQLLSINKQQQSMRAAAQQHQIRNSNFPPTIRANQIITDPVTTIIINNRNIRSSDIDKSRSFDFDYGTYNNQKNLPGGGRLDFDKSRSFDEDYRDKSNNAKLRKYLTENPPPGIIAAANQQAGCILKSGSVNNNHNSAPVNNNNNNPNGLAAIATTAPRTSAAGVERGGSGSSSGGGGGGGSGGSGKRQTSPQNYGTRLCDHELTYDMLRRTLDRSPIMDFSRDYDIPQSMKNRETINAGGNSELNFTSERIYDHGMMKTSASSSSSNNKRILNQSPSDSSYSLDRLNSSRDSITPDSSEMKSIRDALNSAISDDRLRTEYAHYRQHRTINDRNSGGGSGGGGGGAVGGPNTGQTGSTASRGSCTTTSCCDYWQHCTNNTVSNVRNKFKSKHRTCQCCRCINTKPNSSLSAPINSGLKKKFTNYYYGDIDDDIDGDCDDDDEDDDADDDGDGDYDDNHYDSLYENVGVVNKNCVKIGAKSGSSDLKKHSKHNSPIGNHRKRYNSDSHDNNNKINLNRIDGYRRLNGRKLKNTRASVLTMNRPPIDEQQRIVSKPPIYVNAAINGKYSGSSSTMNQQTVIAPATSSTTIIFLGDREMPITRDNHSKTIAAVNVITSTPTVIGDDGHRLSSSEQMCTCSRSPPDSAVNNHGNNDHADDGTIVKVMSRQNSINSEYKTVRPSSTNFRSKVGTSNKGHYRNFRRQRSISLPNLYQQIEFPTTNLVNDVDDDDDDASNNKCDPFPSTLSNQFRAVSSPTLSDNPLENNQNIQQNRDKNSIGTTTADNNCSPFTTTITVNNPNYAGVLQKFKKTFSQFSSNGTTNITNNKNSNQQQSQTIGTNDLDSNGKYRFGPLIWRSSKERRKTKYNRRDKCNSGDSGIQIELENDEQYNMQDGQDESSIESTTTTATQIRVRRTNSTKFTNPIPISCGSISNNITSGPGTAKAKAFKKLETTNNDINKSYIINNSNSNCNISCSNNNLGKPKRSLSQPSGLDRMTRNDLDESDTDSVSSHPDLHEGGHRSIYAEVLFPFTPAGPQELALERGILIEILRKEIGPWWYGKVKNDAIIANILEPQQGWFPKDFVRVIPPYFQYDEQTGQQTIIDNTTTTLPPQNSPPPSSSVTSATITTETETNHPTDTEYRIPNNSNNKTEIMIGCGGTKTAMTTTKLITDCTKVISSSSQNESNATTPPTALQQPPPQSSTTAAGGITIADNQLLKHVQHNNENLRNSVVKELLETEVNYVKLLSTLCLGYLREMRKRIDIFPTDSLNLIFSNIENVWQFQQTFLSSLRQGIETGQIGQAFLDHKSGFLVYSNYCNSYPRALMELESYSNSKEAKILLENIRVAEKLPNLPLSAHLLAPIQRICRYPLHLSELVKHTRSQTEIEMNLLGDTKEGLEIALNTMKKVTETVNEGKRHSEHLSRFQASFENFLGPPIAFHSTRFFMQTDATRVSPNLWNNTYTLFLFDRQLIYCKKDILKRNHFIYKGRIFLDNCRILNLPDGKLFGVTLKNALRIYCESLNKWFDFCFRSANRKLRFLSTLAMERQFCGTNLFVSELAGGGGGGGGSSGGDNDHDNDDNLSDREYHSDYDIPQQTNHTNTDYHHFNQLNWKQNLYDCEKIGIESPAKLQKYCDTLPKKSRKFTRNLNSNRSQNDTAATTTIPDQHHYQHNNGSGGGGGYNNTGSLGRRKIGSWFRKAKSTNTTPTQSPTHNSTILTFNTDSSSQSSPALDGSGDIGVVSTSGTYKSTIITSTKYQIK